MPDTGRYQQVQKLLADAAGSDADPDHEQHGRFWELPYADFMALQTIYNVRLIGEPGPDRGKRSGLIRVLKGEQSGVPRMPLGRPPMSNENIAFIQTWIDDGCPEI